MIPKKRAAQSRGSRMTGSLAVDSDVRCNPVDSIGSSTKVGFPIPNPAFCSVSRGQRRLGEKEYRARSVTPGVALRVRTQGLLWKGIVRTSRFRGPEILLSATSRMQ